MDVSGTLETTEDTTLLQPLASLCGWSSLCCVLHTESDSLWGDSATLCPQEEAKRRQGGWAWAPCLALTRLCLVADTVGWQVLVSAVQSLPSGNSSHPLHSFPSGVRKRENQ